MLVKTLNSPKSIFEVFKLAAVLQAKKPDFTNAIEVSKSELKVSKTEQQIILNESLEEADLIPITFLEQLNSSIDSIKQAGSELLSVGAQDHMVYSLSRLNYQLMCI